MPSQSAISPLLPHLAHWSSLWRTPGLSDRLTITVSTRLRTSLGRCTPSRGELRIAAFLLDGPPDLLREVLCHEAAHAAAFERYGRSIRPHGPEWRELMTTAGYAPRARLPEPELAALPPKAKHQRVLWEHRCPVCHMRRVAGRPVRAWRCRACREAGLAGELEIERISGAACEHAARLAP